MTLAHICYKPGARIVRQFSYSNDPIRIAVIPGFVLANNNGATYGKLSITYKIFKKLLSSFHLSLPIQVAQ